LVALPLRDVSEPRFLPMYTLVGNDRYRRTAELNSPRLKPENPESLRAAGQKAVLFVTRSVMLVPDRLERATNFDLPSLPTSSCKRIQRTRIFTSLGPKIGYIRTRLGYARTRLSRTLFSNHRIQSKRQRHLVLCEW